MARNHSSDVFRLAPCLTSDELLVLLALADYGERIFPSQAALAAKTRLHRSTVNKALQSLRKKEVVQAKGFGKALTYMLDLSPAATGTCRSERQVVSPAATGGVAPSDRDPNKRTNNQPNQGAADAAQGGRQDFDELVKRIRVRDPRADIDAQRRVCSRVFEQHGLAKDDMPPAWRLLCLNWARTGNSPYDVLQRIVTSLEGARDVRAVVLHKIKGVAA
jgi:biotin operon repressor